MLIIQPAFDVCSPFITNQMTYEVYSTWIGDMNSDQVDMLHTRMPTAMSPERPQDKFMLKKVV